MAESFNKEEFCITLDEKDVVRKIKSLSQYKFDSLMNAYGDKASISSLLIKLDLPIILSENNCSTGSLGNGWSMSPLHLNMTRVVFISFFKFCILHLLEFVPYLMQLFYAGMVCSRDKDDDNRPLTHSLSS